MRYLGLLIMLFWSCSHTKNAGKQEETPILNTDKISLSRTGCFGTCPRYTLEIYGDGHFVYDGKAYVNNLGNYKGQLSTEETQALFANLSTYDWASYPDVYPVDNVDFPSFFLHYETASIDKEIKGNSNAAQELIELSKQLDKLLDTQDLEEIK